MSISVKLFAAVPLFAIVAACVPAGGNDRVDTVGEIEATTDTAVSGATVPGAGGVQTNP